MRDLLRLALKVSLVSKERITESQRGEEGARKRKNIKGRKKNESRLSSTI